MSDTGRQSLSNKAGSALKPDSQKGTVEQATDKIKGTMDSAASKMQPDKSNTQRAEDTISGNKNENQESVLDKAKGAMDMGSSNNDA